MSRSTRSPTIAALFPALLLAGCTGPAGFEGPDPLTGGPPIQRRTSPAPSLATGLATNMSGSGTTPAGQLPPVPVPSTATSQAALAGGVSQPQDNSRDLRIGTGAPGPSGSTTTPTSFAQEQPLWRGTDNNAAPTARLNDPQPTGGGTMPAGPAPAGSPAAPSVVQTGGGTQADTFDRAQEQLTKRRVTWQRLETVGDGGEWRFRCAIPNPANPNVEINYEAQGRSPTEAIRKVLDQMALEQR